MTLHCGWCLEDRHTECRPGPYSNGQRCDCEHVVVKPTGQAEIVGETS